MYLIVRGCCHQNKMSPRVSIGDEPTLNFAAVHMYWQNDLETTFEKAAKVKNIFIIFSVVSLDLWVNIIGNQCLLC